MTTTAFVGIGSNLGDREANLSRAISLLFAEDAIEGSGVSQIRETEPVGPVDAGLAIAAAVVGLLAVGTTAYVIWML